MTSGDDFFFKCGYELQYGKSEVVNTFGLYMYKMYYSQDVTCVLYKYAGCDTNSTLSILIFQDLEASN